MKYDTENKVGPDSIYLNQTNMHFRHDINGLRALAVLSVVLYHFGIPGLHGGFIGVDVFFVISGYLMTSIVFRKITYNQFSVWRFYIDRGIRIIPAMVCLCASLLALGWVLLAPNEYSLLAKHISKSLLFFSNVTYWDEAGYFDTTSHDKWLLHTWSLSVEWQFYMLYPLFILAIKKYWGDAGQKKSIILLALVSFGLSVGISHNYASAAFYLLPTRAWEMLAGGLVYLFPVTLRDKKQRALEFIGFGMMAFSLIVTDAGDTWPGYLALIPVTGAAAIIAANRQNSFITSAGVWQWLGNISYSVYLWHWPVVVALRYCERQHDPLWVGAGIVASLVLGQVSFSAIEVASKKERKNESAGAAGTVKDSTYSLAIIFFWPIGLALIAGLITSNQGFPTRANPATLIAESEKLNRNPRSKACMVSSGTETPGCTYGDDDKPVSAIVMGDSHSNALVTAVAESARQQTAGKILYWGYQSCLTVPGANIKSQSPNFACGQFIRKLFDKLSSEYIGIPVVIINRTSVYVFGHNEDNLEKYKGPLIYFDHPAENPDAVFRAEFRQRYIASLCDLAKNRPVYVVKPIPEMGMDIPTIMARQAMQNSHEKNIMLNRKDYDDRNVFILGVMEDASQLCNIHLLDPLLYLCDDIACMGSVGGHPLYTDDDHLSEYGNKLLVPMFLPIFVD